MFRSASLFIGTSFRVAVFTIFTTSNVYSIVGIPHKLYSMQRILIHIKADLFVKCAHLHPGYAANLVARSRYYHCHWAVSCEIWLLMHALVPVSRRQDKSTSECWPRNFTINMGHGYIFSVSWGIKQLYIKYELNAMTTGLTWDILKGTQICIQNV